MGQANEHEYVHMSTLQLMLDKNIYMYILYGVCHTSFCCYTFFLTKLNMFTVCTFLKYRV